MSMQRTVVLDDAKDGECLVFADPVRTIRADAADEVPAALVALQTALDAGSHVAGYFSYELGYLLEPRLEPLLPEERTVPLLWFGVFDAPPRRVTGPAVDDLWGDGRAYAGPVTFDWTESMYRTRFDRVEEAIAAGDTYQVNLSMRGRFRATGDPRALYRDLRRQAGTAHGAYVDDGERQLLSLSPELFFEIDDDRHIRTLPMKGTAPRGTDAASDTALRDTLAGNAKDRAENLMIVDLLRNDLGRVAETGSVRVSELFAVDTYPTVHQMTSTVSARLREPSRVASLLHALFPCGSITGAPKVRAMEIIRDVESSPRGVYCGAIGYFAPDGVARFNVAIRTITLADGHGELGVGGGIVSDSRAEAEYAECLLKARYVEAARRPLRLLETLRWENAGFIRLDYHLARLQRSATVLGLPYDKALAVETLQHALASQRSATCVRLALDETGRVHIDVDDNRLAMPAHVWRYTVSPIRLDSTDALLRHKIDWRELYDAQLALTIADGCDEVLFLNERGEACEGSRSTLFVVHDGIMSTPSLACGVLPGCLRADMLDTGTCVEAVLTLEDLATADAIYFGNSLRGLSRAFARGA